MPSEQFFSHSERFVLAAGTDDVLYSVMPLAEKAKAIRVDVVPHAAITAHATNYTVLTVKKAPTTTIASRTWAATNSAAGTTESLALTGTGTELEFDQGDELLLDFAGAGSGLAVDVSVVVTYERIRG